jgi:F-type H+-transporting ATPase subunit b
MDVLKEFLETLGLEPKLILVLGISFLVLVIFLNKFLFKPLLKHLDARHQEIKGTFNKIELDKQEIARLSDEYKNRISQIEREAYQKIQEAVKEGLQAKTEIISEAHAQADKVLRKAKEEIELEKQKAIVELRNEMVTLALSAAGKVIEKEMDETTHRKLVENFLGELDKTTQG